MPKSSGGQYTTPHVQLSKQDRTIGLAKKPIMLAALFAVVLATIFLTFRLVPACWSLLIHIQLGRRGFVELCPRETKQSGVEFYGTSKNNGSCGYIVELQKIVEVVDILSRRFFVSHCGFQQVCWCHL